MRADQQSVADSTSELLLCGGHRWKEETNEHSLQRDVSSSGASRAVATDTGREHRQFWFALRSFLSRKDTLSWNVVVGCWDSSCTIPEASDKACSLPPRGSWVTSLALQRMKLMLDYSLVVRKRFWSLRIFSDWKPLQPLLIPDLFPAFLHSWHCFL